MISISIITFNILASNFTNYLYGDYDKFENNEELSERYAGIYNTLKLFLIKK